MPLQDLQPSLIVVLEIFRGIFLSASPPHSPHGPQGFFHRQIEQIDKFGHGGLKLTELFRGPVDPLLGKTGQKQVRQVQYPVEVLFKNFIAGLENILIQGFITVFPGKRSTPLPALQPLLVEIEISSPACLGHPQDDLRRGLDALKHRGYRSRFRQQGKKGLP